MKLAYRAWLEREGYDAGTINSRISNAERVEKCYNCDLDDRFDKDELARLLEELSYSKEDERRDLPNPTKIDIDGDIYDGLATLRSALRLYIKFRSNCVHIDRESGLAKLKKKTASKTLYTCPGCSLDAWSEPQAWLICGECKEQMVAPQFEV